MRYHVFFRLAVVLALLLSVSMVISCGGGSKVTISALSCGKICALIEQM